MVEHLGEIAAGELQASDLAMAIPSLGVRSDVAISWDGVSLGAASFSRHETLSLIGLTYSHVQPTPQVERRAPRARQKHSLEEVALIEAQRFRGPGGSLLFKFFGDVPGAPPGVPKMSTVALRTAWTESNGA